RDRLLTSALPECTADTDHSQDRDRCEQSNKQELEPGHEPLSGAVPLVCLCHSTFHGLAEKANGIHQRLIGLSWLKHLAKLCLQRLPVVFSQDTALFRLGENASNKSVVGGRIYHHVNRLELRWTWVLLQVEFPCPFHGPVGGRVLFLARVLVGLELRQR